VEELAELLAPAPIRGLPPRPAEEPNYRYGTGRLLLRITSLGARHREHDGLWLELRGHEVDPTGREDPRERHAVVRLHGITIVSSGDES
jgi:hypothetical protein